MHTQGVGANKELLKTISLSIYILDGAWQLHTIAASWHIRAKVTCVCMHARMYARTHMMLPAVHPYN